MTTASPTPTTRLGIGRVLEDWLTSLNRLLLVLCCVQACYGPAFGESPDAHGSLSTNLLVNGDFEKGTEGWNALWVRESGMGKSVLDAAERHSGTQALRIEHAGQKDWSLAHLLTLNVQSGEIFELAAWVRIQGTGSATLGVVTRDSAGNPIDWAYGGRSTHETKSWRLLRSRFIVAAGTATICPRLIGNGPATVWCDDFTLTRQGSLAALRTQGLPAAVTMSNLAIDVALRTGDATFAVKDRRTNRTWEQRMRHGSLQFCADVCCRDCP